MDTFRFKTFPTFSRFNDPDNQGGFNIIPARKTSPYSSTQGVSIDTPQGNPHTHQQRDFYNSFHPSKFKKVIFTGIVQDVDVIRDKILPRKYTNNMFFHQVATTHHYTVAGMVPNEGLPNLQVSTREEQAQRMEKFGLGFQFNVESLQEEEGVQDFRDELKQLAISFKTSESYRGLLFLMTLKTVEEINKLTYGNKAEDIASRLRKESQFFALLSTGNIQKLLSVIMIAKPTMLSEPNILLLSPDTAPLIAQQDPRGTYFYDYSKNLISPSRVYTDEIKSILRLGNIETFFAPMIQRVVNYDKSSVEVMMNRTQISEFYVMKDCRSNNEKYMDYNEDEKAIELYDACTDKWQRLSFETALSNCKMFQGNNWHPSFIEWINTSKHSFSNPMDGPEGNIFVYRGYDQSLKPIECLGQMNPDLIGRSFEHMAESIVGKFSMKDTQKFSDSIRDGLKLRDMIASERFEASAGPLLPSDKEKWMGKLKILGNPTTTTNTERAKSHGSSVLKEAKVNIFGSIELPTDINYNPKFYPIGFTNFPNFRTLAQYTTHPYYGEWAKIARDFIDSVKSIYNIMKNLMPHSKFLVKENTPIWIPVEDSLNAFSEVFFHTPPPLFNVTEKDIEPIGVEPFDLFTKEIDALIDIKYKGNADEIKKKKEFLPKDVRQKIYDSFQKKYRGRANLTKFAGWIISYLHNIKEDKPVFNVKALLDQFSKTPTLPEKQSEVKIQDKDKDKVVRFSLGASQALLESFPKEYEWKVGNPQLFNETFF
jgi:hypothetical protein